MKPLFRACRYRVGDFPAFTQAVDALDRDDVQVLIEPGRPELIPQDGLQGTADIGGGLRGLAADHQPVVVGRKAAADIFIGQVNNARQ